MKTLSTQLKLTAAAGALMAVLAGTLLLPAQPAEAFGANGCRNANVVQTVIDRNKVRVGTIAISVRTCWDAKGLRGATVLGAGAKFLPSWRLLSFKKAPSFVRVYGARLSYVAHAQNSKLTKYQADWYTAVVNVSDTGIITAGGISPTYGYLG